MDLTSVIISRSTDFLEKYVYKIGLSVLCFSILVRLHLDIGLNKKPRLFVTLRGKNKNELSESWFGSNMPSFYTPGFLIGRGSYRDGAGKYALPQYTVERTTTFRITFAWKEFKNGEFHLFLNFAPIS